MHEEHGFGSFIVQDGLVYHPVEPHHSQRALSAHLALEQSELWIQEFWSDPVFSFSMLGSGSDLSKPDTEIWAQYIQMSLFMFATVF